MTVTFAYFYQQSDAIELPSPELANGYSIRTGVVTHTTMSGNIKSHITTQTDEQIKHIMDFGGLSDDKITELRAWLIDNIGNWILYTDWRGQDWKGHILTNPFELSERSRDDHLVQLVFEGNKYDG